MSGPSDKTLQMVHDVNYRREHRSVTAEMLDELVEYARAMAEVPNCPLLFVALLNALVELRLYRSMR